MTERRPDDVAARTGPTIRISLSARPAPPARDASAEVREIHMSVEPRRVAPRRPIANPRRRD
jgi:hypothetical protein